jgi:hypothetical protein
MKKLLGLVLLFASFNVIAQKPIAVDDYYTINRGEKLIFNPFKNDIIPSHVTIRVIKGPYLISPYIYNIDLEGSHNGDYLFDGGKYYYGKLVYEYLICDKNNIINTIDTGRVYITVNFIPLEGYDSLDINNLSVGMVAGGELFTDLCYSHFREKGEKDHVIFKDNLWMGGNDDGGNLRAAAQTYRQQTSYDYGPGPSNGVRNLDFFQSYERTWKVSKDDLYDHLLNYSNSGYKIIDAIENWPANGETNNYEPALLAPFHDLNNNSMYEPEKGECPCLLGDQMILQIYNDNITHTESGGESLQFEVHAMIYAFKSDNFPALNNTIFVRYKIINRAQSVEYNDLVFGKWIDLI